MARVATDDWLRTAAGLTVSSSGDRDTHGLAVAEAAAATLVNVARALPPCPAHDAGANASGPCRFASREQGDHICDLAKRLGALASDAPATPSTPEQLVTALKQTVSAVYLCRRVRHSSGTCWFHVRGDEHLCGDVLAVAHHL